MQKLEFFCVQELFMTAQARYADLLLPVTTAAERSDPTRPWPSGPYFTFVNRALEPLGECKSDFDIVSEPAERLGIEGFNPHTEDEWLKMFVEHNPEYQQHISDYDRFREDGIHRESSASSKAPGIAKKISRWELKSKILTDPYVFIRVLIILRNKKEWQSIPHLRMKA